MPLQFVAQGPLLLPSASYVGPGNIISGALAWWGLRGYVFGYTGPSIDLSNNIGTFGGTVNILASGSLDTITASALVSGGFNLITKFYDQTGNGNHLTEPVATGRTPALQMLTGPAGTYPAMFNDVSGTTNVMQGFVSPTTVQPYFFSGVWNGASAATQNTTMSFQGTTNVQAGYGQTAGGVFLFAGSVPSGQPSANVGVWQALTHLFSGAASATVIQGVSTTQNAGTSGWVATDQFNLSSTSPSSSPWNGLVEEAGIWAGTYTGPQLVSLTANQRNGGGLWAAF